VLAFVYMDLRLLKQNEAHMTLKKPTPTVKLVAKVPPDIKAWLAKRAEHFGATIGAEVSRCCRFAMEQEAANRKRVNTAEAAE
jgi:hypothetical protein